MKFSLLNSRNLKDKATSIPGLIAVVALALAEYDGVYPHSEVVRPWASLVAFLAGAIFAANATSAPNQPVNKPAPVKADPLEPGTDTPKGDA